MEQENNIAKLLNGCPKGIKLYSSIDKDVFFERTVREETVYVCHSKEEAQKTPSKVTERDEYDGYGNYIIGGKPTCEPMLFPYDCYAVEINEHENDCFCIDESVMPTDSFNIREFPYKPH